MPVKSYASLFNTLSVGKEGFFIYYILFPVVLLFTVDSKCISSHHKTAYVITCSWPSLLKTISQLIHNSLQRSREKGWRNHQKNTSNRVHPILLQVLLVRSMWKNIDTRNVNSRNHQERQSTVVLTSTTPNNTSTECWKEETYPDKVKIWDSKTEQKSECSPCYLFWYSINSYRTGYCSLGSVSLLDFLNLSVIIPVLSQVIDNLPSSR